MHIGNYPQVSLDDLSKLQQSLNLQVIETDKISGVPIFSGDVLWDNPNNYRKCKKKLYTTYFCKPPMGTVVINKFEQKDSVSILKDKYGGTMISNYLPNYCYMILPPSRFIAIKLHNDRQLMQEYKIMYYDAAKLASDGNAYLVHSNDVVISGILGELMVTSTETLAKKYNLIKGSKAVPIDTDSLKVQFGQEGTCLDWTKIKTIPNGISAFACYIPNGRLPLLNRNNEKYKPYYIACFGGYINTEYARLKVNDPDIEHGYGDFIIACTNADGTPDVSHIYVVNGELFGNTYDNRGWEFLIDQASLKKESIVPTSILK